MCLFLFPPPADIWNLLQYHIQNHMIKFTTQPVLTSQIGLDALGEGKNAHHTL